MLLFQDTWWEHFEQIEQWLEKIKFFDNEDDLLIFLERFDSLLPFETEILEVKHFLCFHFDILYRHKLTQLIPVVLKDLPSWPIDGFDLYDWFGELKLLTVIFECLYFIQQLLLICFLLFDKFYESSYLISVHG